MTPNFDIQYLIDKDGNKTAVIIPISEWTNITSSLSEFFEYQKFKQNMNSAFNEVSEIKKGAQPKVSLTDFLDEL